MQAPLFESPKYKLIYVFRINDIVHAGCLKIGETTIKEHTSAETALALKPQASNLNEYARERIESYTKTAAIPYDLLYTEVALYKKGDEICGFRDYNVHEVLLRSGIKRKEFQGVDAQGTEWFEIDLETAKNAIKAVKEGRRSLREHEVTIDKSPIIFRPEQRDAIDRTKKHFVKGNQMLWNAKMRFGKTLSALQVVKEMQCQRTLILTHRPVVDEGWFEDFGKIFFDTKEYIYGSRNNGETFQNLSTAADNGKHIVYFASIQDLRGSEIAGGKFDKNDEVFSMPWNLIIVDEAHEGTQTELGLRVMAELEKQKPKVLRLSGTPFNLLDDFKEEEIYTWDYVMEQRAKRDWDLTHFGDPNPYAELPAMSIYAYDLGDALADFVDDEVAFNFREFFHTDDSGNFIHEQDIKRFLNLLVNDGNDENSCYPFANKTYQDIFRHTLWVLPSVASAKALSKMLKQHKVFGYFTIVNVAGDGDDDEENKEALSMVKKAIGKNPDETYTITLTVNSGRLTTGVTVKEWNAVLMLSGSYNTSASSYMQTIFRVQSPATFNGHTKEDCYVFDFAPDRTLQVLATVPRVSTKAGKTTDAQRAALKEFINFCPVISIKGSKMLRNKMTPEKMLEHLKRAYIERVVRSGFESGYLYSDELLKLTDIDLKAFDKLKKIIGTTKAIGNVGNIVLNDQGLTNEQYEEKEKLEKKAKKRHLTEEEKKRLEELKKAREGRDKAISILRGISIRMPLLIYGAELKDEKVGVTLDNFTDLVDDLSWKEFMPSGVTKEMFLDFKKYYDPEIFSASGKRIRSLARSADKMPIEKRIERITGIFATLRNPDKETVLTPWRVVNMHMGDTLGGYCFFDEEYKNLLDEPRYIDNGNITNEVFASNTYLLEINSKSGLYPLYLAYNVYRRRLEEPSLFPSLPQTLEEHLKVWDKVVAENIFIICKTPMAKSITRRTLVGFRNVKVRTHHFKKLINQIKNKPDSFIEKITEGHSYWAANNNDNMKFNAIVGNPPYQEMDGGAGASATPVYNNFVDIARRIKPNYISMIMPAKWYTDGKGLNDFRTSMLSDTHIAKLVDFTDSRDCFENVDIAGGICYFLWNQKYDGECVFTNKHQGVSKTTMRKLSESGGFIRHIEAVGIIERVQSLSTQYYSEKVSTQKPFGLRTYVKPLEEGDIILKHNKGKGPYRSSLITIGKEMLMQWKIIVSCLTAEHAGQTDKSGRKKILSSLDMLAPNEICTETYLVVDSFDHKEEAENLASYLRTCFVRFLIAQLAATQHISKEKFAYVPLQDFSAKSDIDWSQSVANIDQQLYEKYGLTEEEQQFIEKMIKPM